MGTEHQEVPVLLQAGIQGQRHHRQLRRQLPGLLHERRHLREEGGKAILPVRWILHHCAGSPHLDDLRAERTRKTQPRSGEVCSTRWRRCQRFQVNFYYGAPAPYAESIAPSQHGSTYAHYYEDEEDGWGMPNFYDTYGKNS